MKRGISDEGMKRIAKQFGRKKAQDYSGMTDEEFDEILVDIVDTAPTSSWFSVDGVYQALAEELNNDVLQEWEDRRRYVSGEEY